MRRKAKKYTNPIIVTATQKQNEEQRCDTSMTDLNEEDLNTFDHLDDIVTKPSNIYIHCTYNGRQYFLLCHTKTEHYLHGRYKIFAVTGYKDYLCCCGISSRNSFLWKLKFPKSPSLRTARFHQRLISTITSM